MKPVSVEPRVSILRSHLAENSAIEGGTADSLQVYGWKAILLLQFQPQFEIVIMLSIYLAYISSIVDIAFAYATSETIPTEYSATLIRFTYLCDVVYLVDILSMITYKNIKWEILHHFYDERHTLMVILDIISIIPMDAVYYSLTIPNMRLIYFLRLRYVLRIFRLNNRIHVLKDTVGHNNIIIQVSEFLINFSLVLITLSCVYYGVTCQYRSCSYRDSVNMVESLYVVLSAMTSRGFSVPETKIESLFLLLILINFFSYLYLSGVTIGRCIIVTTCKLQRQHTLSNFQQVTFNYIHESGCNDPLLYSTSKMFFSLLWKQRKGIISENFVLPVIPEITAKEIRLDITWNFLKHSHLFNDKEVHFLRSVAEVIKHKFMIPGEVIYMRNHLKSAVVYIVTGVIQILSEQDDETPIFSLSGGTCIGESTIVLDSHSPCIVVCQSYCEVNILYRKDFLKMLSKYPKEYAHIMSTIKNRCKQAKEFQTIMRYLLANDIKKIHYITLRWLKATLNDLMIDPRNTRGKGLKDKKANNEYDSLVFCTDYLDMLVISEQIELVTDAIFLKETCPCIVQPDSFIINIWKTVMAVIILIFIFLYPYFACFQSDAPTWYFAFAYVLTIMYALDIYINISTAIKTKDGIITDISKIASIKATKISFLFDVIAAFPLELLLLFVGRKLDPQVFLLLQMPRLLKSYEIRSLFNDHLGGGGNLIYLKHIIYTIILVYYAAAVFYLTICFRGDCIEDSIFLNCVNETSSGHTSQKILIFVSIAAQQLTGLSLSLDVAGDLASSYNYIIILEFIVTVFYIYFLASTAAVEAMMCHDKLRMQQYIAELLTVLQKLQVNPKICREAYLYIRAQVQYNKGYDILHTTDYNRYYNPVLSREFRNSAFSELLKSVPLFQQLPNEVVAQLAGIFRVRMFGPDEIITYAGETCKEMYIIQNGFCQIIESSDEKDCKVIGPGYAIAAVEICFGIPVAIKVVTTTHCKLISATSEDFLHSLQSFSDSFGDIHAIVNELLPMVHPQMFTGSERTEVDLYISKKKENASFKNFGYWLNPETVEGIDYHSYFDKLEYFSSVRFIFMRHTIRPNGMFIRYWEISRCFFAFITAIFAPVAPLNSCNDCAWYYIFIILDAAAWIDVYIRHHICYYDKNGIEITHPLKTAVYYWSHGFFIDILGVIPFEHIIIPLFQLEATNRMKVYLKNLRLLQIHRIISGIFYLDGNFISASKIWILVKYLPCVLLIITTAGALVVNKTCEFGPEIKASDKFSAGVTCNNNSWVTMSKFAKPLNQARTYLYGLLYSTVTLLAPGLGGVSIQMPSEFITFTIGTLLGFWMIMFLSAQIISANLFRNANLTQYQESMSALVKFLSYKHIDKKLKNEVIGHFEYIWHEKRGKDLNEMIKTFEFALQENILFDVYGKAMKESTVFATADSSFFRSLLLTVKHKIIINHGIVCKVNDVQRNIHFIYKGRVAVLGPDYNQLLELTTGSLFGNLDNCCMSRQTLTMVAKGHVELLCIESLVFHKMLEKYPNLKSHYHQLTAINTDYIQGAPMQHSTYKTTATSSMKEQSRYIPEKIRNIINVFNSMKQYSVWDATILIFVCYIGSIVELYQITVNYHPIQLLIILYFLDILFLIDIYLNFQTAYENEFGILVTDKRSIAMRYIKSPTGFGLHISSVIPFEIISLCFTQVDTRWTVWSYCRANRIIRMFFVNKYLKIKNQQLNINVYLMRFISLLVWISLVLQMLTSLLILTSCMNPSFNISPQLSCNWTNMTSTEKLGIYLQEFHVVLHIFTQMSLPNFFPNARYLILLTILLIIGCRYLAILFVAEVSATLKIVYHNRILYEERINILREYMIQEQTSTALLERVWLYVCLLWKHKRGMQFPNLLDEAPYYLQEGVLNSMYGCHLRKHIIIGNCHIDLIRQMAARMRPRTFFPGDYITFVNDADECMYFIDVGSVDALSEDEMYTEKVEKILYEGEMFGYDQGVFCAGHEYTYRANTYSVVLVLERKKWIYLLDFFPASMMIITKQDSDEYEL